MAGSIITILAVCALVGAYMFIVHSFLRAAEEPEDEARLELERKSHARKRDGEPSTKWREPHRAH